VLSAEQWAILRHVPDAYSWAVGYRNLCDRWQEAEGDAAVTDALIDRIRECKAWITDLGFRIRDAAAYWTNARPNVLAWHRNLLEVRDQARSSGSRVYEGTIDTPVGAADFMRVFRKLAMDFETGTRINFPSRRRDRPNALGYDWSALVKENFPRLESECYVFASPEQMNEYLQEVYVSAQEAVLDTDFFFAEHTPDLIDTLFEVNAQLTVNALPALMSIGVVEQ
jgi:hypothetical protein